MRRRLARLCLVSGLLLPSTVVASPPSEPVSASPRVAPPKSGKTMVRVGMAFTVFGAVSIAGGSAFLGFGTWNSGHGYGIFGSVPLVAGGGFLTLGALLLHHGQERRWARADWAAGRPLLDRNAAPKPGAGLLLTGTLTLAGSATIFTWGLQELTLLDVECGYLDVYCTEGDPQTAALILGTTGAGMLLGATLTILGARQRARYMDWRVARGRPIELRPTGWASARHVGFGVQGRF